MIDIQNLTHDFGSKRALEEVGLQAVGGEVVGLIGPNGAGKTTLMRAMATLLRPSAGTVHICGQDALIVPSKVRRLMGYLPERAALYPELCAWEYLDLFAEIAGHRGPERRRRVDAALDAAELHDRRDALTRELSKGLAQRLALQATLLHDPKVLVLDEPTDGLDPQSRESVLRQVRALADGGRVVILSSHVLAEIEEVADRTVILVHGRVAEGRAERAKRYLFRVREGVEDASRLLAERPEAASVSMQQGTLLVELATAERDAASLAAALVGAGFALLELREETETLRERLRNVTGERP